MIDELGNYSLSDFLLFSRETYLGIFERYNEALWPAHILAILLGAMLLWIASGRSLGNRAADRHRGRIAAFLIASTCGWVGWAFFLERYLTINPFASYLGVLFFVEVGFVFWFGLAFGKLEYGRPTEAASTGTPLTKAASMDAPLAKASSFSAPSSKPSSFSAPLTKPSSFSARSSKPSTTSTPFPGPSSIGIAMIAYAVLIHPFVGLLAGRSWSQLAVFGLAPDPTAVAALGLALADRQRTHGLLLLPMLLWSVVSTLTAIGLNSIEWIIPAAAGTAAIIGSIWKALQRRG